MVTKKTAKNATKRVPSTKKKAAISSKATKSKRAPRKKVATSEKRSKSAFVKKLLDAAEKKMISAEVKTSIGDVIRLLQLQKELEQEEPREITIQWIEREEMSDAPGK